MSARQVRVTLEGAVSSEGGGVMRLRVGAQSPAAAFPLLVLDTSWPGVSVEDVAPEHRWTDGDVVQTEPSGWTLTRAHGVWRSSHPTGQQVWHDDEVTKHLTFTPGWGQLRVLRYQAGEQ